MKSLYTLCIALVLTSAAWAQSSPYWTALPGDVPTDGERRILPDVYRVFALDTLAWKQAMTQIPQEQPAPVATFRIQLPMPDGSLQTFEAAEVPTMEEGLAVKYPLIKTFWARGVDNPYATARLDWTYNGFHAMVRSWEGTTFVDPYSTTERTHYVVYHKRDLPRTHASAECLVEESDLHVHDAPPLEYPQQVAESAGPQLRTYRMAMSSTGEYSQYHGGNKPSVLSEMVTLMNRVNGVYETEVAIRMILVANNDQIIYLNAGSDPFNNNNSQVIVNQNQSVVDNVIGSANYDIGHVVSTGGGGYAPGNVCQNGDKARAVTGLPQPVGDPFYIDYVCHEVGHQFSGGHTFNGSTGSCAGARWFNSAYEPGSGTTIMGYAGICPGQNVANNSDDYFHTWSYDQIFNYSNVQQGNTCAVITNTGNSAPNVSAGTGGYLIPAGTPFELTGTANDPDGDALTYCWEQFDIGPQGDPNNPSGNAPIFRSFEPTTVPSRTFPQLSDIVNNTQTLGEILPTYSRTLNFRLTARDNRAAGGGVSYDGMSLQVTSAAGPFRVLEPNTSLTVWTEGVPATVNWDVANTNGALINCANVDIRLSLDGGYTYPITLATSVANDGEQTLIVPQGVATTQARVRVQCSTNVFFDISDQNFTIIAPPAPTYFLYSTDTEATVCAPDTAMYAVNVLSLLNYSDPVQMTAVNVPAGVTIDFSSNPVQPGDTLIVTATATSSVLSDTYPIQLRASSTSGTDSVTILFTAFAERPTVAQPAFPADGSVQAPTNLRLRWDAGRAPHTYRVQVADEPTFASPIVDAPNLTTAAYVLPALNPYQVYYWRVSADNQCVTGEFSEVYAFRTASTTCETVMGGTPRTFFNTVALTYNSPIQVSSDLSLLDVNVIDLNGTHTRVSDLSMILESPAGTRVTLFDRICGVNQNFNLSLDDEAAGSIPCPPTGGGRYRPEGRLGDFVGEQSAGTWTLIIQDHLVGDGGSLAGWGLELCEAAPNANADPVVERNDTLQVERGRTARIDAEGLLATDADHPASSLTYRVIVAPMSGTLMRDGVALAAGDTFGQTDVDAGLLSYAHDETATTDWDAFQFEVVDGAGGWSGLARFYIDVVEDRNEFGLDNGEVYIYPNPTTDLLQIQVRLGAPETLHYTVYDGIGRTVLARTTVAGVAGTNRLELSLAALPAGVYFLAIEGENFVQTEKVVVQRK